MAGRLGEWAAGRTRGWPERPACARAPEGAEKRLPLAEGRDEPAAPPPVEKRGERRRDESVMVGPFSKRGPVQAPAAVC
ncbi:hypothetical protein Pcatena_09400 [Parolsenella catena]|uniref:Uncharacterized protein n=1 Tax=Parolsenella catena TaxID=2003188 RepID=A0A3G9JY85_9ACTN|nr:hypothetical protein Pcatena_09400 [Parolsenella catena]